MQNYSRNLIVFSLGFLMGVDISANVCPHEIYQKRKAIAFKRKEKYYSHF